MDKYAAEFCRAQDASGASNVAIAQAMGIHPTNVSQWRSGNRPIPADKAVALASLVGADAARISEAYGRVIGSETRHSGVREPVLQSQSQPVRLDPVMLSQAYKVLLSLEPEADHPFSLANLDDAAHFVQVYEMRAAMPVKPSAEEWVEFGRKLTTLTPTGGGDGRGGGVMPATGTGKGKVAGKVRRKA